MAGLAAKEIRTFLLRSFEMRLTTSVFAEMAGLKARAERMGQALFRANSSIHSGFIPI